MPSTVYRVLIAWGTLALLVSGCLPSGCGTGSFDEITPADSLSRALAQDTPVDSLYRVRQVESTGAQPIGYPRTLHHRPDGSLIVSDAERNSLHHIAADGTYDREVASTRFDVPYLTGVVGDTIWVFNAESDVLVGVVDDEVLDDAGFAIERADEASLAYTAAHPDAFYLKLLGEEIGSTIYQYDWDGTMQTAYTLPQEYWRYAGFLRVHNDEVWSLSGLRPVVDRLPLDLSTAPSTPDTLALRGFDSPMLERSYAFLRGDTHQPPLLIPSVDLIDDRLFVLNVRSGWIQVDVFGDDGALQRRLIEANPQPNRDFFPQDLSVHSHEEGYDITIAVSDPAPMVVTYRWTPEP